MKSLSTILFSVFLLFPSFSYAAIFEVLVAPKDSAAYEAAQKKANGKSVFAERKIHKAFAKAGEIISSCGTCEVNVKLATGNYVGKGSTGSWEFPEVIAPNVVLRILGGYDDNFGKRAPFDSPTMLRSSKMRSSPVLHFLGKKHALKELVISGLTIDVSPGNRYDKKTNTLSKGTSSSWVMLALGYLTTNKLEISDNVLMNAANGAAAPLIRAASANTEIHVRNNFILNNILTWRVNSPSGAYMPSRYVFENNSFIMGWPYNPDRGTSNPGTLEIGGKYSAAKVEIKNNLFAYNVGGAIFPQWDDSKGPPISIRDNLFFDNGALFSAPKPAGGAVVGKFGGSAGHSAYDMDEIEEDFSWDVSGNVSFDPEIDLPVLKMQAVSYGGEKTVEENSSAADVAPAASVAEEKNLDEMSLEDFMNEPSADSAGGTTEETEEESASSKVAEYDYNLEDFSTGSFEMDEFAVDGSIKNYAPLMPYNPQKLPFAKNQKAAAYGVSRQKVKQY